MTTAVRNALKVIQSLSRKERTELMAELGKQIDESGDAFDAETMAELRRRNVEFDRGRMPTVMWSDVAARVAADEKQHG